MRASRGWAVWSRCWRRRVAIVLVAVMGQGLMVPPGGVAAPPQREPLPATYHLVGEEDVQLLDRVQQVIDDWNSRRLVDPYVRHVESVDQDGKPMVQRLGVREDLNEFIADYAAAEALGKAFFWEMQAGSDFRREQGKFIGTACASCHYRHGADARDTHTTRIPFVAWEKYRLDGGHPLTFGEKQQPFNPLVSATTTIKSLDQLYDPRSEQRRQLPVPRPGLPGDGEAVDANEEDQSPRTPLSLIVGSQGVERRKYQGLKVLAGGSATEDWYSEASSPLNPDPAEAGSSSNEWEMFSKDTRSFRQITPRNSPSVFNATFSDRLFHDGRASSTFNGFSIFGDSDDREVIHIRREQRGRDGSDVVTLEPVRIALTNAALASQALGPIVNEVEMSYQGRTFHDLGRKLLDATPLGYQSVDAADSHLGWLIAEAEQREPGTAVVGLGTKYRKLIQRAFRREWWDGAVTTGRNEQIPVPLRLARPHSGANEEARPTGPLMEANFSLYWGLSIMLYEASLVSNDSPFDRMMAGDPSAVEKRWTAFKVKPSVLIDRVETKYPPPQGTPPFEFSSGAEVFQRGFRAFLSRGCHDCHAGPLFSETYSRERNSSPGRPIAHAIEQTLLPTSRGDAIALALRPGKQTLLAAVAEELLDRCGGDRQRAVTLAGELDLLREEAAGLTDEMEELVKKRLHKVLQPVAAADAERIERSIAKHFMDYERSLAKGTGNRTFFSEDERVAYAHSLGLPLLVEKTPLPPGIAAMRARLPLSGPPASAPYAFYDSGFYNLGVAPPRYDRGIGDFAHQLDELDDDELDELDDDEEDSVESGNRSKGKSPNLRQGHHHVAGGSAYSLPSPARLSKRRATKSASAEEMTSRSLPDTSWYRNVPMWPGDDPAAAAMATQRRSEVHLYSRARQLVLTEVPWGHRKPLLHDNELLFWGSFKTPSLRNVELTGPYMHNGRLLTIMDVLDFYDRGGDIPFDSVTNPDKHPAMRSLSMSIDDKYAVAFFLACLTDDRVRYERGPFDHPSLRIANGYAADPDGKPVSQAFDLPAVGVEGSPDGRSSFPSSK
ncbi:MAG: cytochrome C peroxidase [Planctomycetota bacterium]|nr:cytochrome C peroxidase [Planctomycetota bacterium]